MRHKTGKSREHDAEKTERTEKTENGRAENKKMDIALSVGAFAGCNQLLRRRCHTYVIFFGITLIPAVSLTYLAAVYFRLGIFQRIESREHGLRTGYALFFVLQNDGHFAFASISVKLFSSFSFVEKLPGDAAYELLPGERQTFETKLTCRYRESTR